MIIAQIPADGEGIGANAMEAYTANVACTKEYLDDLERIDRHLFRPECFSEQERSELEDLTILTRHYRCEDHPDYTYALIGSEKDVLLDNTVIHSYRTHDTNGFHWPFKHGNGKRYLVYTQDLYGYSVLDLATAEAYRYYPQGSFPAGETFIWCDLHYNPLNSIAAVDGCYWACPSSIVLADFTDPMRDATYIDLNEYYHDEYNDIQFVAWDGTDLIGKILHGNAWTSITIRQPDYMKWLHR